MIPLPHVAAPLAVPVAAIGVLLLVATVAVVALRLVKPASDWSELTARVRSWWVMAALFLGALLLSRGTALAFFGVVSFWALREFFSLVPGRFVDRVALFSAYAAIPLQYLWIGTGWHGMSLVFVPVWVFLWVPFVLMLTGEPKGFVASASRIHWGTMVFVFGLSHGALFLALPPKAGFEAGPQGLLLFLVVVTELNDVFQYLVGKSVGRHRITPVVSPKKTWEGFLGGVVLTSGLAWLLRDLTPLSPALAPAAGALLAATGFVGDVVMSAVKRDVGVKDASDLIPGHGGVLDRIDSLCYTAPVFFHLVKYVAY